MSSIPGAVVLRVGASSNPEGRAQRIPGTLALRITPRDGVQSFTVHSSPGSIGEPSCSSSCGGGGGGVGPAGPRGPIGPSGPAGPPGPIAEARQLFSTIASLRASETVAQIVSIGQDANGSPAFFLRDNESSDPDDGGKTVIVRLDGVRYRRMADVLAWVASEQYQLSDVTYTSSGHIDSAAILWPDGSDGVFEALEHDRATGAVNAFRITHPASNRVVTQATVTRDPYGSIISKPALVISSL